MPSSNCLHCGHPLPAGSSAESCRACLLALALGEASSGEYESLASLASILNSSKAPEEVQLHRFGDYELLEEVARGGMGVVFKAQQVSVSRCVALKFIRGQHLESQPALQRFQLEAEATARLDHPHIVPIYDAGEHQGYPFLSMRFVEGESLANRLDGRKIPQPQVVMAKIARAVHYAHGRGILHRDLKPANILIDTESEPYVTDFGLAKLADTDSELTRSSAMMGTPRYMSPEQCRGENANISTASDIFALGVILYEMVAGRVPFDGDSTLEVIRKVNNDSVPTLALPSSKRDLATICLKCLEKEPTQRYGSALAFAEDLERFERGEPILARPVGTLERVIKWTRRKPALAVLGATAILSMLLGTGVSLWQARVANEQATMAQASNRKLAENLYAADMAVAFDKLEEGRFEAVRALLQRHIPDSGGPDLRAWEWRWLWCQSQGRETILYQDPRNRKPIRAISATPEGTAVAFGLFDGTVLWCDMPSGRVRTIREKTEVGNEVKAIEFSQDGLWMAVTSIRLVYEDYHVLRQTDVYAVTDQGPGRQPEHTLRSRLAFDMPTHRITPLKAEVWWATRFVATLEDRTMLVIASQTNGLSALRLWDFQKGEGGLGDPFVMPDESNATISPDGRLIVAVEPVENGSDTIHLFHCLNGQHKSFPAPWAGRVRGRTISHDGRKLAIRIETSTIAAHEDAPYSCAVIRLPEGKVEQVLEAQERGHGFLRYVGGQLTTTFDTHTLQVWETSEDDPARLVPGAQHIGMGGHPYVTDPTGKQWMVTGHEDGSVRRWDLSKEPQTNRMTVVEPARTFPFSPKLSANTGTLTVWTGTIKSPQEITIWDMTAKQIMGRVSGLPLWMSPDGKRFIVARYETPWSPLGYLRKDSWGPSSMVDMEHWNLTKAPPEITKAVPVNPSLKDVTALAVWPGGKGVVFGTVSGEFLFVDVETGEVRSLASPSSSVIAGVAISPNERYLAYLGHDSGIYDLVEERLLKKLTPAADRTTKCSFSPDSRWYLHPGLTGILEVHDLSAPEAEPQILRSHTSDVRKTAFTPDGKTCATFGRAGSPMLKLWNVATWREMGEIPSSWDSWEVLFSDDGNSLITDGFALGEEAQGRLTIRTAPSMEEIDAEF